MSSAATAIAAMVRKIFFRRVSEVSAAIAGRRGTQSHVAHRKQKMDVNQGDRLLQVNRLSPVAGSLPMARNAPIASPDTPHSEAANQYAAERSLLMR